MRSGVVEEIHRAGGEIFAITSEPQSLATEAAEAWGLGYEAVGDPHHEILDLCRERGWLDLFVTESSQLAGARSWASHLNGHFQPGLLALDGRGRVLYRWRSRPTRHNLGGATGRPSPTDTWTKIVAELEDPSGTGDQPLDEAAVVDTAAPPWPLFVVKLFAHGWFVRPKVFPLGRPDDEPSADLKAMGPRIAAFALAWVVAFVLLPARWVLTAAAAYAAAIAPSVIQVHRQFQNVTDEPGDQSGAPTR